jgi:ABC-type Fe3+-citrate transport system substrate-binding protein
MKLKPSEYYHHSTLNDNNSIIIQDEGRHEIGLIAQEVYEIIPEAVNKPENENKDLWSISYDKLIPVLVNAVKEQQQQIESYKSQLQSLQQEVEEIKASLATSGGE